MIGLKTLHAVIRADDGDDTIGWNVQRWAGMPVQRSRFIGDRERVHVVLPPNVPYGEFAERGIGGHLDLANEIVLSYNRLLKKNAA